MSCGLSSDIIPRRVLLSTSTAVLSRCKGTHIRGKKTAENLFRAQKRRSFLPKDLVGRSFGGSFGRRKDFWESVHRLSGDCSAIRSNVMVKRISRDYYYQSESATAVCRRSCESCPYREAHTHGYGSRTSLNDSVVLCHRVNHTATQSTHLIPASIFAETFGELPLSVRSVLAIPEQQ